MGRQPSYRQIRTPEQRRLNDPWDHMGWTKWEHLPGALQCAVFRAWIFAVPCLPEERLRLHFAIAVEGIGDCLAVQHEEPRWMVTHLKGMLGSRVSEHERLPGMVRKALSYFFGCSERAILKRCGEDRDRWKEVGRVVNEVLTDPALVNEHLARLTDDPGILHWRAFAVGDWRLPLGLTGYPVDCEGRFVSRRVGRINGSLELHRIYHLWRQLPPEPDSIPSPSRMRIVAATSPSASDGILDAQLPFTNSEDLPWAEYDAEFVGKPVVPPIPFHGSVESQ